MPSDQSTGTSAARSATDGSYTVDVATSRLTFQAKAFGTAWVRGQLPVAAGTIHVTDDTLRGHGELAANQVDTGLGIRDWHLRSAHYLHTTTHPRIRVTVDDANLAAERATCHVTVRETTSTVTAEIRETDISHERLRMRAHIDLDRTAFPMLPPLAGVSRLVGIDITIEASPSS